MANVKIVTDSLADIPLSLMQGLDITIVPCTVQLGNKTYRDKLDLSTTEFYRLLATTPKPARLRIRLSARLKTCTANSRAQLRRSFQFTSRVR